MSRALPAPPPWLAHALRAQRSGDRAERWALRREAYRTLAAARADIALSAAELPDLARHTEGTDTVAATLERLVDTTTACAVHLDDTGRLTARHTRQLEELIGKLELERERLGLSVLPVSV
ncbi:hypothetical protein ACWCQN_09980 [Streptomyces sp. NPDC001984]